MNLRTGCLRTRALPDRRPRLTRWPRLPPLPQPFPLGAAWAAGMGVVREEPLVRLAARDLPTCAGCAPLEEGEKLGGSCCLRLCLAEAAGALAAVSVRRCLEGMKLGGSCSCPPWSEPVRMPSTSIALTD